MSRKFWQSEQRLREFDSKYEGKVDAALQATGLPFRLTNRNRETALPYQRPVSHYHPDHLVCAETAEEVRMGRGFIIESKGRFLPEDRTKLLLVKLQHPLVDLRILFMRPQTPLYKGAKTTYAGWCDKHGLKWAKGPSIPQEWIEDAQRIVNSRET